MSNKISLVPFLTGDEDQNLHVKIVKYSGKPGLNCTELFNQPLTDVYAWTDSTIVLNWLVGSPRRFKIFVGNRVAAIVDCIPPDRWNHVAGVQNPADCASRGLFPAELISHDLWWNGPTWLKSVPLRWPKQDKSTEELNNEENEICLTSI